MALGPITCVPLSILDLYLVAVYLALDNTCASVTMLILPILLQITMSWFDTSNIVSLAKSTLKEAQKTIDKALDITDEDSVNDELDKSTGK